MKNKELCTHPAEYIEYGSDDERGECQLCGATCDWHYEEDCGNVEDFHWCGRERVPHEWYEPHERGLDGRAI